MKYDPIMCMMVPDTVNTKDASWKAWSLYIDGKFVKAFNSEMPPIKEAKEYMKENYPGKVAKLSRNTGSSSGYVISSKDSDVKTKDESYVVRGKKYKVVRRDGDNVTVIGPDGKVTKMDIDFLMSEGTKTNDSNTIDKAIATCDKTEFDPQDISYIRKAIGTLKAANSLLGMINERTVNKAKQNIANTISLLESID